jgi:hypothetical protein
MLRFRDRKRGEGNALEEISLRKPRLEFEEPAGIDPAMKIGMPVSELLCRDADLYLA